jgi:mannose-6-phosphate isomerase-like protein (cupin superfamily)
MARDAGLGDTFDATLRDALIGVWDQAHWRETYRDTNIGEDFLTRFGCYELAGWEGHFTCQPMRSFLVYSEAGLYYPWHHHPSEEMYVIVAGSALFEAKGREPRVLGPGDAAFHASNQPHAMTTSDKPVLAYVVWRGPDMNIAPVLTD